MRSATFTTFQISLRASLPKAMRSDFTRARDNHCAAKGASKVNQKRFDQIAEGWDAAAEEYAQVFAPFTALFADDVLRICPPQSTARVLEIAAGNGALSLGLAAHSKSVLATDLSPNMVVKLSQRASQQQLQNIEAITMDAEALSVGDEQFDAVYCLFGVMFFSNRDRAFAEMARVLRPGGQCVIVTWNEKSELLRPVADAVQKLMPDSPVAQGLAQPMALGEPVALQNALEEAAFRDVTVHVLSHTLNLSKEAYLDRLPRVNPSGIQMLSMLPPDASKALRAQIAAGLDAQSGGGSVALEGVANIGVATK